MLGVVKGVVKVSFCLHKKSPKFLENKGNFGLLPAGDERIELPPKVLETPIIPFDQSPVSVFLTTLFL